MDDLLPGVGGPGARPQHGLSVIPPAMTDDAEQAGLRFFHDNGHSSAALPPPEVMCGGVGLLDYDVQERPQALVEVAGLLEQPVAQLLELVLLEQEVLADAGVERLGRCDGQ